MPPGTRSYGGNSCSACHPATISPPMTSHRPRPSLGSDARHYASSGHSHICSDGWHRKCGARTAKRKGLPVAYESRKEETQIEKAKRLGCVHAYYLGWAGKCDGCRQTPLSPYLPDPKNVNRGQGGIEHPE